MFTGVCDVIALVVSTAQQHPLAHLHPPTPPSLAVLMDVPTCAPAGSKWSCAWPVISLPFLPFLTPSSTLSTYSFFPHLMSSSLSSSIPPLRPLSLFFLFSVFLTISTGQASFCDGSCETILTNNNSHCLHSYIRLTPEHSHLKDSWPVFISQLYITGLLML